MAEVTIERLGHKGDGIAAGPIFVPRTLPGEVVKGDVAGQIMPKPAIQTPSDHRIKAPCSHYNSCGGCSLQHAHDDFVSNWKKEVVQSALASRGIERAVDAIHTSPAQSRRRAKLTGKRTKSGALVGFHGRASHTVLAVPNCKILHPDLLSLIPVLEQLTFEYGSRKGEVEFTATVTNTGIDLDVAGAKPAGPQEQAALAQLTVRHGVVRLTWNGELLAMETPPQLTMGKAAVSPPSGAFLQATEHGQLALEAFIINNIAGAAKVADLFAGCGTFSLPMAAHAAVHAVEGEADMIDALAKGWRMASGLHSVTTEARDLFRRPLMPDELRKFDVVVLDPPRAGAEAQVQEIIESEVRKVVMISCSPVTFARDAEALTKAGFSLEKLEVVDQFRWSHHVEVASVLTR